MEKTAREVLIEKVANELFKANFGHLEKMSSNGDVEKLIKEYYDIKRLDDK